MHIYTINYGKINNYTHGTNKKSKTLGLNITCILVLYTLKNKQIMVTKRV